MTISIEIYNSLIEENQHLRSQIEHYKEVSAVCVDENSQMSAEVGRLQKALDELIDNVLCLCSEGPDVMRSGEIYKNLLADAQKARQAISGAESHAQNV